MLYKFLDKNGNAIGTQGWDVSNSDSHQNDIAYTGLYRNDTVIAVLVSGYVDTLIANGNEIVSVLNVHAELVSALKLADFALAESAPIALSSLSGSRRHARARLAVADALKLVTPESVDGDLHEVSPEVLARLRDELRVPVEEAVVIGAGDSEAVFVNFCEREGYPSVGVTHAALRAAFYEGIKCCSAPFAPVAARAEGIDWERVAKAQDAKLRAMCSEPGGMDRLREVLAEAKADQAEPIKKWQDRYALLSTGPNPLVAEQRKGACRDAEIADLRAALAAGLRAASGDLADKRRTMFAAYSKCLVGGDAMTPDEIADRLLAATQPAAAPADGGMPPLPPTTYNACGDGSEPLYTPEMTHDYARAYAAALAARKPAAAVQGMQELYQHEDHPMEGLDGDKPFCRFFEYYDGGDASVGEPSRSYWALSEDQSGTELADLLAARKPAAPSDRYQVLQEVHSKIRLHRGDQTPDLRDGMNKALNTVERMMLATKAAPSIPAQAGVPDGGIYQCLAGMSRIGVKSWQDVTEEVFSHTPAAQRRIVTMSREGMGTAPSAPAAPTPPSTLGQQVAAAQAEVAGWSDDKRASVRLEGGVPDGWMLVPSLPDAEMCNQGMVHPNVSHRLARECYIAMLEKSPAYFPASSVCPVCGIDTPHMHTSEQVVAHRNSLKTSAPSAQSTCRGWCSARR